MADDNNSTGPRVLLPREEPWYVQLWRPITAWVYLSICVFDFVIGPFFYAWFAYYTKDFAKFGEWQPLTLGGGGVFHVSMGAILGVSSWSRGRENLEKYKLYQDEINASSPQHTDSQQTVSPRVQERMSRFKK